MALSQSLTDFLLQGQTIMICQLCEIEPKLKWKCLECKLLICQRCRNKVHPKFPSAQENTIIELKDISQHQTNPERNQDLTRMKCELHDGNKYRHYCKTCQSLVCRICVTGKHKKHEFGDIDEEYTYSKGFPNQTGSEHSTVNTSIRRAQQSTGAEKTAIPLQKLADMTIQDNANTQIMKKFNTSLNVITSFVLNPDRSFLIVDGDLGDFQKVKSNGDTLDIVKHIKLKVNDAVVLPSGDLLLSVFECPNLKLVPSGSTCITYSVYSVSPLLPLCHHMTSDQKVKVGASDADHDASAGPKQVIVLDQAGNHEKVFQYGSHGKPLFVTPIRVTSMRNYIAVVDRVSVDSRGRVVVLDQDGKVKYIYTGHPDINIKGFPFRPVSITTLPNENFVVSDPLNHTLHILNIEGDIITFYNTDEMGIFLPWSLSCSLTGQLCIGSMCEGYKWNMRNAEILIVTNFIYFDIIVLLCVWLFYVLIQILLSQHCVGIINEHCISCFAKRPYWML